MAAIHRQSDENENHGIRKKVDTEIYPVMSLAFLIDIHKGYFLKAKFYQKKRLFFESLLYGPSQITPFHTD